MFFFDNARRGTTFPRSLDQDALREPLDQIRRYFELDDKRRSQTDVPTVWKRPFDEDVLQALTNLSHGKCAFCEQQGLVLQPYRFRPPAYAEPRTQSDDKDSYLWLAFSWENLFPICQDCRQSTKSMFPVEGIVREAKPSPMLLDPRARLKFNERPILLSPGERSVSSSAFGIRLDGILVGKGPRSRETVERFDLNRRQLVERRAIALQAELDRISMGSPTQPLRDAEFGGSIFLLQKRLADAMGRPPVPAARIGRVWREAAQGPRFREQFAEAVERLKTQDAGIEVAPAERVKAPRTESPLNRVRIRNFKSLEFIEFDMPKATPVATTTDYTEMAKTPCLLILGENSTGKSSILEAIALASIEEATRRALIPAPRKLTLNPDYMGAQGRRHEPRESNVILDLDDGRLEISIEGNSFIDLGSRARPQVFAYGAHRLYGDKKRSDELRHVDTLFKNDRAVSNPEPWLVELHRRDPKDLDEVASALRHIIQIEGEFRDIEVAKEGGKSRCYININRTRADGTTYVLRQRLDAASSGYRAVLALVCDIFQGLMESQQRSGGKTTRARAARESAAIVLVDEIEAHLHPRWKLQIIAGLRAALPQVTFIITSHDPLCVRGMGKGEVMMLNRYQNAAPDQDRTMPEVVERITEFDDIENFTIEQLLTSELFQLYSTDDRRTEETFARVAKLLAEKRDERELSPAERADLERFRSQIADALPYGRNEVTQLVQEAVAEYLANRRAMDSASANLARTRAKAEVADFLREILE
ncbi:hypothetical protein ASD83_12825 [Devosia sp. Root685]|uniref:AAA family ATPase n=1 Tax=Devosia sp. Root685 TaxID=1736587 RepID=UPI0006F98AE0|nr:AAA family ATPase [Devosia sp. Root685]KRA97945.1 hypothetical protein ASD83_12825 [Devosia sp. Root685]